MERYHFDDLPKINVPFGLLNDETQERLKTWPHGHEFLCGYNAHLGWVDASPHWSSTDTYRAKPSPASLTKPHIPDEVWCVLPDWVTCAVKERDGEIYGMSEDAFVLDQFEGCWCASKEMNLTYLKGITPGTCDWRDSLVRRW